MLHESSVFYLLIIALCSAILPQPLTRLKLFLIRISRGRMRAPLITHIYVSELCESVFSSTFAQTTHKSKQLYAIAYTTYSRN